MFKGKEGRAMKKQTKELIENDDNNTDIIIEYLKLILERLDVIIAKTTNS